MSCFRSFMLHRSRGTSFHQRNVMYWAGICSSRKTAQAQLASHACLQHKNLLHGYGGELISSPTAYYLSCRLPINLISQRFYSAEVSSLEAEEHPLAASEEHETSIQGKDRLHAEEPFLTAAGTENELATNGNSRPLNCIDRLDMESAGPVVQTTENNLGAKVEEPALEAHASSSLIDNMAVNRIDTLDTVTASPIITGNCQETVPHTVMETVTTDFRDDALQSSSDQIVAKCDMGSRDFETDKLHETISVQSKTIQDLNSVVSNLSMRMDDLIASNSLFLHDITALKATNNKVASLLDALHSSLLVHGQRLMFVAKFSRESLSNSAPDQASESDQAVKADASLETKGIPSVQSNGVPEIGNADQGNRVPEIGKRRERKQMQNIISAGRKVMLTEADTKQRTKSPEDSDSVTGVSNAAALPINKKVMKEFEERLESIALVDDVQSAEARSPPITGEHTWPEWKAFLEHIKALNFFSDEETMKQEGGSIFDDFSSIKIAVYKYSNANASVFQSLSRKDLKTIAEYGCPSDDRHVVTSVKRLRSFFHIEEKMVSDPCVLKESCEAAYVKPPNVPPKLSDVTRILIKIAEISIATVSPRGPIPDMVKSSASRLFHKIIDLGTNSYEKGTTTGCQDAAVETVKSGNNHQLSSSKAEEKNTVAERLYDLKSVKQSKNEDQQYNARIEEVRREDPRKNKVKERKLSDLVEEHLDGFASKSSREKGDTNFESIKDDDEDSVPRSKKTRSKRWDDGGEGEDGSHERQPRSSKNNGLFSGDWDDEEPDRHGVKSKRRDNRLDSDDEEPDRQGFKSNRRDSGRSGRWDDDDSSSRRDSRRSGRWDDDDSSTRSRNREGYNRSTGNRGRERQYGGSDDRWSGRGMGNNSYGDRDDSFSRSYGRSGRGSRGRSSWSGGRGRGRNSSRF